MNKWMKSPLAKGLLIVVAIFAAGCVSVSLYVMLRMFPHQAMTLEKTESKYLESETFEDNFFTTAMSLLHDLKLQKNFESDGQLDEDRLVDVELYANQGRISGSNSSGFAYTLGELLEWSENYNKKGLEQRTWPVVVCQKADGGYYYYYTEDFEQLLKDGQICLADTTGISTVLTNLKAGDYADGSNISLLDAEGNLLYANFWTLDGACQEKFAPEGSEGILDLVNQDSRWNGRLSDLYAELEDVLSNIYLDELSYESYEDTYQEGNTNFCYLVVDLQNHKLSSNRQGWNDFSHYEEYLSELKEKGAYKYCVVQDKLKDCTSNLTNFSAKDWRESVQELLSDGNSMKGSIFAVGVDTSLSVPDDFRQNAQTYEKYAGYQPVARAVLIVSGIAMLAALLCLTLVSGRTSQDEECHLHAFDRMPSEVAAIVVLIVWMAGFFGLMQFFQSFVESMYESDYGYLVTELSGIGNPLWVIGMAGVWSMGLFLIGYLSLVRRIKGHTLWENSLLKRFCVSWKHFWENRSAVMKVLLAYLVLMLVQFILLLSYSSSIGIWHFLLFALEFAGISWLINRAVEKEQIRKWLQEISSGRLDYQIPTEGMRGEFRDIAEQINHIGDGLQRAVEKSLKDERMKTDLITNVSHDIKTPLTSIINYVDLLKRENFEDPKIRNYLQILEQKALRLKQLTEDVVEASKVSSGNITLECTNLNLVEMLYQVEGEFEEKFTARKLQPVLHMPEEPAVIYADGRRMWRVLSNIYNNAAKYAMPGTRIYLDVELEEKRVIFSMKNVSEQALNISADELTERFIRGDVARSTEGSGLGLSIAQNLTILQKGEFKLYLDGDLFRVTLIFPRVVSPS